MHIAGSMALTLKKTSSNYPRREMAEGELRGVNGWEAGRTNTAIPLQVRLCSGAKIPNLKALPIKGTGELWKSTLANNLP